MTDTELLIRETLVSYAEEAELADLVRSSKARSRELDRDGSASWRGKGFSFSTFRNRRVLAVGGVMAVVVLLATAFALGGASSTPKNAQLAKQDVVGTGRMPLTLARPPQMVWGVSGGRLHGSATTTSNGPAGSVEPKAQVTNGANVPAFAPPGTDTSQAGSGVTATRVVKTGALGLRVAKGAVPDTVTNLTRLATGAGGYVSPEPDGQRRRLDVRRSHPADPGERLRGHDRGCAEARQGDVADHQRPGRDRQVRRPARAPVGPAEDPSDLPHDPQPRDDDRGRPSPCSSGSTASRARSRCCRAS